MIEYNKAFIVSEDCPVEDICDEIRSMNGEECRIEATWHENSDDTITVTINGFTHTDELTYNYTPDIIDEQISKLKGFHLPLPY